MMKKDFSILFDDRTSQGETITCREKFAVALREKQEDVQGGCEQEDNLVRHQDFWVTHQDFEMTPRFLK